ncbi:RNA polymerase sigma factor [Cellulosilyticum sp. I15G10I2]|uniref:RNA polymerase sigma factor n=1 Tax=Cellulosilyticum sp. I15G10I2 TaxID=1892843 RepID=UPI00085CBA53|nr:sigma-70 family RNA polymerase sigma factor [Cellulosilyticum sp. I15G10I2]
MHEDKELQLINDAKHGDVNAFEVLISAYEKKIYNICLRMLCSEPDAYDAAQEVCIKIWKQLYHFKGDSKLSTWIYRIATNECLDKLRKAKSKREISLFQTNEKDNEVWVIDKVCENENVISIIENKALQEILKQAMTELKEEHRTMIVLRDINAYAYDEIAAILSISLGTVKSRLSRARLALKKILQQNKEPYKSFFVKKGSEEGEQ